MHQRLRPICYNSVKFDFQFQVAALHQGAEERACQAGPQGRQAWPRLITGAWMHYQEKHNLALLHSIVISKLYAVVHSQTISPCL